MKKYFLSLIFLAVVFGTFLLAQKENTSIDKRWKTVETFAEKQLPESALKEVEIILNQAKNENNFAEIIKALVYKMRFTLEKNPNEAPALIKEFEGFAEKNTDPALRLGTM